MIHLRSFLCRVMWRIALLIAPAECSEGRAFLIGSDAKRVLVLCDAKRVFGGAL